MNSRLETILSSILTVCAVAIAGVVVYDRLLRPTDAEGASSTRPHQVDDWDAFVRTSSWIGSPTAQVRFVAFSDFQCPFCRDFQFRLDSVLSEFDGRVSFAHRHLPLQMIHKFAKDAAIASECAGHQGRFKEMVHALYQGQDSIGSTSWNSYALAAQVENTARFDSCLKGDTARVRVEVDEALAATQKLSTTPSVFVNGWRVPGSITADTLRRITRSILDGDPPYRRRLFGR